MTEEVEQEISKEQKEDFQQMLRNEIQHAQMINKEQEKEVDPPPADQFQITHPSNLTNQEMETMKLAAQFVALNGPTFLKGLTDREINNPRFEFLKPTHHRFTYFTNLIEAYIKVSKPKHETVQRYQIFSHSETGFAQILKAGEQRQMYQA